MTIKTLEHLNMASHELGDLLWKSKTFQKLLSHSLVASGAQHLSQGRWEIIQWHPHNKNIRYIDMAMEGKSFPLKQVAQYPSVD